MDPAVVSNANCRPGMAAMIVFPVTHFLQPRALRPVNRAPSTGPDASPFHTQLTVSGDHSPIRATSEMSAHTSSDEAVVSHETLTGSLGRCAMVAG